MDPEIKRLPEESCQEELGRLPSGDESHLGCGKHRVTAQSYHVLFDVNGKNDAAAVILSNLWQSTEGISPPGVTRHRVVLVMSQHELDVITTNTTLSRAEK